MNIINMAIIFLVISIAMFIGGILISSSNYSDSKNQTDCETPKGQSCGIWINNKECKKGKLDVDGITCESDGTVFPLILIIVSVILFLISIGCFIRGFMLKHHK